MRRSAARRGAGGGRPVRRRQTSPADGPDSRTMASCGPSRRSRRSEDRVGSACGHRLVDHRAPHAAAAGRRRARLGASLRVCRARSAYISKTVRRRMRRGLPRPLSDQAGDRWPTCATASPRRPAPTCCSTAPIRCIGSPGTRPRSPRHDPAKADPPVGRLCGLPLVPRHGARELRESCDRRLDERALRQHQGRSGRAAGSRSIVPARARPARPARRLAADHVSHAGGRAVLGRHLFSAGITLWPARLSGGARDRRAHLA